MTRSVLNGSPDSATTGGEIEGSGSPVGAGRSGPSPMAGTPVWTLFTGSGNSDWFTWDRVQPTIGWEVSPRRWIPA